MTPFPLIASTTSQSVVDELTRARLVSAHVPFIQNLGQAPKGIKYYAPTFAGRVMVTEDGRIIYALSSGADQPVGGWVVQESLIDPSRPVIAGLSQTNAAMTFISSHGQSLTSRAASTFETVTLGQVYDGVELRLRAYGDNVEKLFYLSPSADVGQIRVGVEGVKTVAVDESGQLELTTERGAVRFTKPIAYQHSESGDRQYVEVAYTVSGNEYSFKVGSYDKTKSLVIDPLLASTFLGGDEGNDVSLAMLMLENGELYVAGHERSDDFPTIPGPYEGATQDESAFVLKFDRDLSLLGSVYMPGARFAALATDGDGNVFAGGNSVSTAYPTTPGAFQERNSSFNATPEKPVHDFVDGVIAKFDSGLTQVLASTYFGGGEGWDEIRGLVVAQDGSLYASGEADSVNFPTTNLNGFQSVHGGGDGDAFIARLDSGLTTLLGGTLLGGTLQEGAEAMAFGANGDIYITGRADSATERGFSITEPAYDAAHNGGSDVFVAAFDADLMDLRGSTFIGGSGTDRVHALTVAQDGAVFVSGWSNSTDFPVTLTDIRARHVANRDAFVAKFDARLENLLAARFLGGYRNEAADSMFLDAAGSLYVAGRTASPNFPTTQGALSRILNDGPHRDPKAIGFDVFLAKLTSDLELSISTFLGGANDEYAEAVALDDAGRVAVAGFVDLLGATALEQPIADGSMSSVFDGPNKDNSDVFVAKLDSDLSGDPDLVFEEVTIEVKDGQAAEEGRDPGSVVIKRTGDASERLKVYYDVALLSSPTLINGAQNGEDFQRLTGATTLAEGQTEKTISIIPVDDINEEADETVTVALLGGPGYVVGLEGTAMVEIIDDDKDKPLILMDGPGAPIEEEGRVAGRIVIKRASQSRAEPLTVFYTLGGDAVNGVDYELLSGEVTIPAGSLDAEVMVAPIDDDDATEGIEQVVFKLESAATYNIGTADVKLAITDNDTGAAANNSGETVTENGVVNEGGVNSSVSFDNGDSSPDSDTDSGTSPTSSRSGGGTSSSGGGALDVWLLILSGLFFAVCGRKHYGNGGNLL